MMYKQRITNLYNMRKKLVMFYEQHISDQTYGTDKGYKRNMGNLPKCDLIYEMKNIIGIWCQSSRK